MLYSYPISVNLIRPRHDFPAEIQLHKKGPKAGRIQRTVTDANKVD
jgi:hypothetical protein